MRTPGDRDRDVLLQILVRIFWLLEIFMGLPIWQKYTSRACFMATPQNVGRTKNILGATKSGMSDGPLGGGGGVYVYRRPLDTVTGVYRRGRGVV